MSEFSAIVGNRKYLFDDFLLMSDKVREVLASNKYESNGCGTNWFNQSLIFLLQKWAGTELIRCCVVHDCSYSNADGTLEDKIKIDSDFHINIYRTTKQQDVSFRKARIISRLFHMAVFYAGPSSYKFNR